MVNSKVFTKESDLSKRHHLSFIIQLLRLFFLLLIAAIMLSFQFVETPIDVSEFLYPVYFLLSVSFFIQILSLIFLKVVHRNFPLHSFLFFFEAIYITGLIYFIGVQQSILVFLYLMNLIFYGVLFQRKMVLILALWTSVLFSFIISIDTSLGGNTIYLAVGINNFTFFTVAYLSGFLGEQFNLMGIQLKESAKDVKILKNLNNLILNNMSSGLITIDNNHLVLQANPEATKLLNEKMEDIQGENLKSLIPDFTPEACPSGEKVNYVFHRGNEKRLWTVTVNELFDESRISKGKIINFQDETHVRLLEKRLRQSEKMAAIGQLAAGIAHEIRNPLAGISGSVQLLQDDKESGQNEKLMGIITREIDRLNHLITEFLDFARPEAPMEDKINLESLLTETVQLVKNDTQINSMDSSINCDTNVKIKGNRDKLKQAFLNIIVNAFQAMEKVKFPKFQINIKREEDLTFVTLKDNGTGMSEQLKERIFEPFHTTKGKGTGLGLSITHSILESHGARIQVESKEGLGSEFQIYFPKQTI